MSPSQSLFILLAVVGVTAAPVARDNTQTSPKASLMHKISDFDFSPITEVQLGPRPYYLVDDMTPSDLKTKLSQCKSKKFSSNKWAIGHRGGGPLQFPEHSVESNLAGARMGAGILECDVSFTKDRKLICRHSQCDLHTTTNVVTIPELNAKCTQPFTPAKSDQAASAKCCTSDFTLEELRRLCAKMDSSNATATNPEDYQGGIATWRTSLYNQCGTLLTLGEHIDMTNALGLDHTPELKTPMIPMPFDGDYTQEKYAQQFVDEYKSRGVAFNRIWPQSFLYDDILYWLKAEPEFAQQALYLDNNGDAGAEALANATKQLQRYKADGLNYVSPPTNYLLSAVDGNLEASDYAKEAKRLGLGIITWSLERSGPLASPKLGKDSYYSTFADAVHRDGDLFVVIDALANKAGVKKIFSDWTATVTYYADCMGLN